MPACLPASSFKWQLSNQINNDWLKEKPTGKERDRKRAERWTKLRISNGVEWSLLLSTSPHSSEIVAKSLERRNICRPTIFHSLNLSLSLSNSNSQHRPWSDLHVINRFSVCLFVWLIDREGRPTDRPTGRQRWGNEWKNEEKVLSVLAPFCQVGDISRIF